VASHLHGDSRVQDAYSLRCTPQVHGAARDTLTHAEAIADRELVAAIDNPMILPDGRVESCGNFHGAPIGYVLDFLAIAVADLGALSERRTDRMLDVARSWGLPPFLSPDAGVNSGMMIAHYTQAAMVSENRRLAVPASVDTMATSAMQEDHVSMGWNAARKLRAAIDNLARILAVELTCAARAIDLRAPLQPGPGTAAALAAIRAAYVKAGEQRSFRARMVSESDGKVQESTVQYAAPASLHMVMKTQNMEQIVIGGTHYIKSDGKWSRLPIATGDLLEQFRKDPQAIAAFERSVSGAQVVGPEAVGGQRAMAYRYHQAAKVGGGLASSAGWVKLWIGANGLPLKAESDATGRVMGFSSRSKTTIIYEDYGSPVRIVAPM
jgi:hypothetical protein